MARFPFLTVCFLLFSALFSQARAEKVDFIVPVRTVYPGQVISNVALSKKGFYIRADSASLYVVDTEQVMNKVARGTLVAGKPIALSMLGNPLLVARGQTVKLVFRSGGLVITAMGVALQPGAAGDAIKMRNVDSGRVVTGAVMEDGSVRVGM